MEMKEFQTAASGSLMLVPAVGVSPQGDAVSFLFTISQVEDILGELDFSTVPFSPTYISGLSDWRGQALPVLSLELLLGLAEEEGAYKGTRSLVVKKTTASNEPFHWRRALVRVGAGCRLVSRIPETEPLPLLDYLDERMQAAVKGVYRWEGGILMVPNMDHILSGELNGVFSNNP